MITCRAEDADPAAVCQLEPKEDPFPLAIGSPPEAWAEATLFVCDQCGQKAFVLNQEVSEPVEPTLWGEATAHDGENRDTGT